MDIIKKTVAKFHVSVQIFRGGLFTDSVVVTWVRFGEDSGLPTSFFIEVERWSKFGGKRFLPYLNA